MRLPPALVLTTTLAAALLVGPRDARAEINVVESVEWMTTDSDLVIRGTAFLVRKAPVRSHPQRTLVTVSLGEILKPARPRWRLPKAITFEMSARAGRRPRVWKRRGVELLLFLVKARRVRRSAPRGRHYALRPVRGSNRSVVRLSGPTRDPVYTMGFQVLRRRADILRAVSAAVRMGGTPGSHRVDVPGASPAYKALWGGSSVWMYVPRGARLWRLAGRWLKSRSVHRRVEGVKALATHRSRATIRRLRRLLRDRDHWIESSGSGHTLRRARVYAVRRAAYRALRAWKIPVRKPVFRVPLP